MRAFLLLFLWKHNSILCQSVPNRWTDWCSKISYEWVHFKDILMIIPSDQPRIQIRIIGQLIETQQYSLSFKSTSLGTSSRDAHNILWTYQSQLCCLLEITPILPQSAYCVVSPSFTSTTFDLNQLPEGYSRIHLQQIGGVLPKQPWPCLFFIMLVLFAAVQLEACFFRGRNSDCREMSFPTTPSVPLGLNARITQSLFRRPKSGILAKRALGCIFYNYPLQSNGLVCANFANSRACLRTLLCIETGAQGDLTIENLSWKSPDWLFLSGQFRELVFGGIQKKRRCQYHLDRAKLIITHLSQDMINNYRGLKEIIKIPEAIANPSTASNVLHITRKVVEQVELENQFAMRVHLVFQRLSEEIQKTCLASESRFNSLVGRNTLACKEVVKFVYIMFRHSEQQAFKNQITLKTISKTQKDESILKAIEGKMSKASERIRLYDRLFDEYQKLETVYIQKSQKFESLNNDTVKFYSTDVFNKKMARITSLQLQLQKILQRLKGEQAAIQMLYRETRKLLADLLAIKIRRIHEIVGFAREVVLKMLVSQDIIVEEGSKDYQTYMGQESMQEGYNETPAQVLQRANQIVQKDRTVRSAFSEYIGQVVKLIEKYKNQLVQLEGQLPSLGREKRLLDSTISKNIYCERTDAGGEIKMLHLFLQKLLGRLRDGRTNSQYEKLQDDLLERLRKQIKNLSANDQAYKDGQQGRAYLKKKQSTQAHFVSLKFKEDLMLLLAHLRQLSDKFPDQVSPYNTKVDPKTIQDQVSHILDSEYLKVLSSPFIMKALDFKFVRSPHINQYIRIKNGQNNMDDLSLELSHDERSTKHKCLEKALCCGNEGDDNYIDQYNCALVNKILLQGKMFLYKRQMKFVSLFNRSTLFGKTKIRIPAQDIINIEKDTSTIGNGIAIETVHGTVRFTSFLTNPVLLMRHHYLNGGELLSSNKQFQRQNKLHLKEQPFIAGSITIKARIWNRLIELGYIERKADQMYKTQMIKNTRTVQVIRLAEINNSLAVSVEYSIDGGDNELYKLNIKKGVDGSLDVEYQASGNKTKYFKLPFMSLIKTLIDNDQMYLHNTRSQIFQISSIADNQEKDIQQIVGKTPVLASTLPKSILKQPTQEYSPIVEDEHLNILPPRLSNTSFISAKPMDRSVLRSIVGQTKAKVEVEQEFNPIVLYALLGIFVLVLVVII